MRIAFMGTPDFSVPALKAIIEAGHDVVAVYSQPPSRSGRGKKERPSPVHAYANDQNIPVYTPLNFKSDNDREQFADLNLDVAMVVAYGLILPQEILDAPKYGCLNIHASLLPRWRGAAPIHRAIMAGDNETGVGIMQMEAGLDTGPVHLEKRIPIGDDTTGILHDKLSDLGAKAIVEVLVNLSESTPTPQSDEGVTYAHKIDKSEAKIDWSRSATDLKNHIHGLSPFPGAWCDVGGERFKIHNVEVVNGNGEPGEMIDEPLVIACGDGAISVKRAQRAGKGPMDVKALMNGFDVTIGTKFS
ncbi:methionyl-tRNA formyltransferase [Pseudemcibacter aquimaris]|uniref:methionyl-tRNA formyltransferase n=1 Tax=Pseudemcibacter aquimaris TaxID=2857064 RepID=UPI0020112A08|nr:methionyl-tRNA formyltransferase [Pseudemcibacter aquimaris]MCC3861395.1 methionyl-tRNA formyltransferase [Pseudemcibacter aquimaris]WDU58165.1 methionyl-tRNA formyltransferase [Pseudemcibacter aquimaris]